MDYALYKGDEFLIVGTAEECAKYLNVKADSIKWMSTPTAKRRLKRRKRKEKCISVIKLEEDDQKDEET